MIDLVRAERDDVSMKRELKEIASNTGLRYLNLIVSMKRELKVVTSLPLLTPSV